MNEVFAERVSRYWFWPREKTESTLEISVDMEEMVDDLVKPPVLEEEREEWASLLAAGGSGLAKLGDLRLPFEHREALDPPRSSNSSEDLLRLT